LDQVTGAELEGEIPSYAEHDDLPVKVPALKELLRRGGFRHRWPLAPQGQLFKFAPEPQTLDSNIPRQCVQCARVELLFRAARSCFRGLCLDMWCDSEWDLLYGSV